MIATADGHGGERYFRADAGSRFAVEAARECVSAGAVIDALKSAKREKERDRVILQLKKSVVSRWNGLVAEHVAANPFAEDEFSGIEEKYANEYRAGKSIETAYGSTLIAALQTNAFLLVLQIGDGNCVTVDNMGRFAQPVQGDENCVGSVTTSLCDKNVIEAFRHSYCVSLPAAVLVGTDGIYDCFAGDEKLYDFYRVLLLSFVEKDERAAQAELIDYLPRLSEKGSGDDISIGMIADIEMLRILNLQNTIHTTRGNNTEGSDDYAGTEKNTNHPIGATEG
jgi:serine/threonine protein phosphatase PrpC